MTGNPVGLVEFLQVRLDERQEDAEESAAKGDPNWSEAELHDWLLDGRHWPGATLSFIAANDPAYVLADVEAKRRIIELRKAAAVVVANPPSEMLRRAFQSQLEALDMAIALFAQPFKDHPDWQEQWNV